MKPIEVIKAPWGGKCRLFREIVAGTGAVPKLDIRVEVCAYDLHTNRSPAFLLQLLYNVKALHPYVRKIEVDGFKKGHKPGWVISMEGLPVLVQTLRDVKTKDEANIAATEALDAWFTSFLIPRMLELKKELVANVQPAPAPAPAPVAVGIELEVDGTLFRSSIPNPEHARITLTRLDQVPRVFTVRELFQAVNLM